MASCNEKAGAIYHHSPFCPQEYGMQRRKLGHRFDSDEHLAVEEQLDHFVILLFGRMKGAGLRLPDMLQIILS